MASWISDELEGIDFGDKRLNCRMASVANSFMKNHTQRVCQVGSPADAKGAYRMFSNNKVLPSKIREPHHLRTAERAKKYKTVLNIQDSCNIRFPGQEKADGLGYLVSSVGTSPTPGALTAHNSYLLSPDGLPLGLIDQQVWPRFEVCRGRSKDEQKNYLFNTPFEEKESMKWVNGMRAARELVDDSIDIINVADREADIYEFMYASVNEGSSFIVRARNDRYVDLSKTSYTCISEMFLDRKTDFKTSVDIAGNSIKEMRTAKLEVRFQNVTLGVPLKKFHPSSDLSILEPIKTCIIWVSEKKPPKGIPPISWLIITNKRVQSKSFASKIVDFYSKRWLVEIFHKSLKSGCKIESCRLEEGMRITRLVTLSSIIAHRLMELTYLYRIKPSMRCGSVLSEYEWKALWIKFKRNKNFPDSPPTLRTVVTWIATLGGFLWRKSDGPPGIVVMWNGWKKLSAYADGLEDMQLLNSETYG